MKVYQVITILTVFLLTFIHIQLDPNISYIVIIYTFLTLPIFIKQLRKKVQVGDRVTIAFLVFLVIYAISTFLSIDQSQSISSLSLFFCYFSVFLTSPIIFDSFNSQSMFYKFLIGVAIILSLISFYNTLVRNEVNKDLVGVSFFWIYYGHNHLSALLILTIPAGIYLLKKNLQKIESGLFILLINLILLVSLFFTFSRGSVLSLIVALILTLFVFKLIANRTLIFLSIAFLFIVVIFLSSLQPIGETFGVKRIGWGTGGRVIYWDMAFHNGLTNPLFGSGPDTFRELPKPKEMIRSDYSHNFFIQLFSDTGFLGFGSGVTLFTLIFYRLYKNMQILKRKKSFEFYLIIWIGIVASFLNSLVDFDWSLPTVFFMFWILVGFLINPKAAKDNEHL